MKNAITHGLAGAAAYFAGSKASGLDVVTTMPDGPLKTAAPYAAAGGAALAVYFIAHKVFGGSKKE